MSLAKAEVVKLSVSRISWSDVLVPSLAREAGLVSFAMMFFTMTSLHDFTLTIIPHNQTTKASCFSLNCPKTKTK